MRDQIALGAVVTAAVIASSELVRIVRGARQTAIDRKKQRELNQPRQADPEPSDWEKLEAITAELQRRGIDAHLEHFGAINVDVWWFGVEEGELRGNDDEGNTAATLPTAISADSIETFLKGARA